MKTNQLRQEDPPIDEYTGEPERLAEDAGKVVEIVPVDSGKREGEDYLLEEETSMDHMAADEDADVVAQESATYTDDEDIKADFEARQELAYGGREELETALAEHHATSPELSGGDLDADWEDANTTGEETVGGTTPTPDQDNVDELGEALGLTYKNAEPLNSAKKLRHRDEQRWELNPKSAEAEDEDL